MWRMHTVAWDCTVVHFLHWLAQNENQIFLLSVFLPLPSVVAVWPLSRSDGGVEGGKWSCTIEGRIASSPFLLWVNVATLTQFLPVLRAKLNMTVRMELLRCR